MITVFEAARLARVSAYTINRQAEQGELHVERASSGALLICLASLANWAPMFGLAVGPRPENP
jgi:hypothetical protein